ncbi:MAG: DUF4956 domain-containing protein [Flavobacteriales bacterium]
MDFLGIPVYDDDFIKLIFRFFINLTFTTLIIQYLYFRTSKLRDYLFTFYMISIIVFLLCFTLKKYELDIGMALGLFAIFGIIRYRTDPIPIKEMTYLFVVIGVSVINALANKRMSYAEIFMANIAVTASIALLEFYWLAKRYTEKNIVYENIELIKPEHYDKLKSDLEHRTGLSIEKVLVKNIDFLKDTANLTIYYYEDHNSPKNAH